MSVLEDRSALEAIPNKVEDVCKWSVGINVQNLSVSISAYNENH